MSCWQQAIVAHYIVPEKISNVRIMFASHIFYEYFNVIILQRCPYFVIAVILTLLSTANKIMCVSINMGMYMHALMNCSLFDS